ncbi:hypothetical protein GU926_06915 [Nibribacter ruber]|uniref:Lipoprotein n=1 Tax=Nibribacter ruber TaxID=2698458 RepID=A0A6P1NYQ1_9BACT|nr:DUF6624 domain-containing protein [Nibribacter ruber]QHL87175.1 hypothetical protein GU926_06915 [Nibribacter ruber]
MQHLYRAFLFCVGVLLVSAGCAQTKSEKQIPYEVLRVELEQILDSDQAVREGFSEVKEEDRNAFFQKMQKVDSVNQAKVLTILKQYGWLPQSKVGQKAAEGIFFVIQHSPLKVIETYLPQMKKLAQEGEASKTLAAMMEDRLLMFQGKKQIYGTQANTMVTKDGTMAIWPIENPEKVNERRKTIGFSETVEEYARLLKAAYNPKEELPANPHRFQ